MQRLFVGRNVAAPKKKAADIYSLILSREIRTKQPEAIVVVLQTWEACEGLHQWKQGSSTKGRGGYPSYLVKAIHYLDKLFQGTAFAGNPFLMPYSDIAWTATLVNVAIKRFYAAACDPLYFPANIETKKRMQKTTIMDFLWNAPYERAVTDLWIRSPLVHYHLNPPILNDNAVPKKEPVNRAFFDIFVAMYEECTPCKITLVREHNMVVLAAARYYDWYRENRVYLPKENQSISYLVEKIKERLRTYNNANIRLVNVCSPRLFADVISTIHTISVPVFAEGAETQNTVLPPENPSTNKRTTPLREYAGGREVETIQNDFLVRGEVCPPLEQLSIVLHNHLSLEEFYTAIREGKYQKQEGPDEGETVDRMEHLKTRGK